MSAAPPVPQRPLGSTGLDIPALAFGAGPVSALMTDTSARDRQLATVRRALELGVDWFDTAATYGNGASEESLGWTLRELGATRAVRIGTKVRLTESDLGDIAGAVRASVEGSLRRLGVNSVALLQLHNSVTRQRGDQPTSITPEDVLRADGVLAAFEQLRREGLVQHFGLTGLGDAESLEKVLRAEAWATMQVNLNLCDSQSALTQARLERAGWTPALLAIRVFAGGALAGKPPSAHTLTTKFFPLAGYERDLRRAAAMRLLLPADLSLPEAAVRFAVHHARVTSAIIGFGSPEEVADAARWAGNGPLPDELVAKLTSAGVESADP
jgi:aryl-alcohol dehydrogenase-like predicted oxidoreductase